MATIKSWWLDCRLSLCVERFLPTSQFFIVSTVKEQKGWQFLPVILSKDNPSNKNCHCQRSHALWSVHPFFSFHTNLLCRQFRRFLREICSSRKQCEYKNKSNAFMRTLFQISSKKTAVGRQQFRRSTYGRQDSKFLDHCFPRLFSSIKYARSTATVVPKTQQRKFFWKASLIALLLL